MSTIHAEKALLPDGWQSNVRVTIEADGTIAAVERDTSPSTHDERASLLTPGMPNVHSHAFQRAMAGLTEIPGPSTDSFWSWRDIMYRFALSMSPEQLEAIATCLYIEMLEAGFTHVGEFHYLHHSADGRHYTDIAEMANRIVVASQEAGIGLTLLPVFYAHSDFGGAKPTESQRRFVTDLETYSRLLEASRALAALADGVSIGVAPHSLRAVTPEELAELVVLSGSGPFHIHVAEQHREVEGCLAWSGARPVEWLLDHADVDDRWCLIHATHMDEDETARLAKSGAIAGLCPVTEANLGDGVFSGRMFLDHGGRFGIGSDSNTRVSVPAELAQLEYSQRLALKVRNVLSQGAPTGRSLYDAAAHGGQQALGLPVGGIEPKAPASLVALRDNLLDAPDGDHVLNRWIFSEGVQVDQVWVRGRLLVQGGRHIARDAAATRYRATMRALLNDLVR